MRIGFTDFRKQMLEEELKNVEALLPQLGVKKVILTGAMIPIKFGSSDCLLYTYPSQREKA